MRMATFPPRRPLPGWPGKFRGESGIRLLSEQDAAWTMKWARRVRPARAGKKSKFSAGTQSLKRCGRAKSRTTAAPKPQRERGANTTHATKKPDSFRHIFLRQ